MKIASSLNLENEKILIIGGAGFIGSHTADKLINLNSTVAIVDNFSTSTSNYLNKKAKLFEIDASTQQLEKVFVEFKPTLVITLASVVDIPIAIQDPILTCSGISATVNSIALSVQYGVKKLVYASSGYIYGNAEKMPIREDSDVQTLNPYNIAKATGEKYLSFFNNHHKLPCTSLRYAPTYGPRRNIGPIFDYIKCISSGMSTKIYGNKTRDYIYVEDVAEANVLALKSCHQNYSTYNIGTGSEVTLDEVYAQIAKILDVQNKPVKLPSRNSEVERFVLDTTKAKRELGFEHSTNISEGLRKTILWYLREHNGS